MLNVQKQQPTTDTTIDVRVNFEMDDSCFRTFNYEKYFLNIERL